MEFSGHKVFVVGGSRGIGAAIVRRFSAAGATVIFTYAASADYPAGTQARGITGSMHTIDGGFAA